MNDLYQEILVKRKTPAVDQAKIAGMLLLTVILVGAGLFVTPFALIIALVMVILCVIFIPNFNLEYEYLYVNGDFDIDKIMNRNKRKKVASYDLANLEIGAPTGSHELDAYMQKKDIKVRDFSSQTGAVPTYTMIYNLDGTREMVILEIGTELIQDMRRHAPRKIYFD